MYLAKFPSKSLSESNAANVKRKETEQGQRRMRVTASKHSLLLLIIMSLMIVTVNSAAIQSRRNQTTARTIRTRGLAVNGARVSQRVSAFRNSTKAAATATTTTSTTTTTTTNRPLMQLKQSKLPTNYKLQQQQKMRAQAANATAQQHPPNAKAKVSETLKAAHVVRHATEHRNVSMPAALKQTIYGAWHGKAIHAAALTATATANASSASAAVNELDAHTDWQQGINADEYQSHLYKRLPQPIKTDEPATTTTTSTTTIMTTLKTSTTHIPLPPRLRSTEPSAVGRRDTVPTVGTTQGSTAGKTTPALVPTSSSNVIAQIAQVSVTPSAAQQQKYETDAHIMYNKIPDSLPVLVQLGNWTISNTARPQLALQPSAVKFRSGKANALLNFQRSKRFMPAMQLTMPMQYHVQAPVMMMPLHAAYLRSPLYNAYAHAHAHHSKEQLYRHKPRLPLDMNMLAKQQQQQKSMQQAALQPQHSNYPGLAAYQPFMQSYAQLYAQSNSVTPVPKVRRVPFNVNVDVYPVLQPTKPFKASPLLSMDYHHTAGTQNALVLSARPA